MKFGRPDTPSAKLTQIVANARGKSGLNALDHRPVQPRQFDSMQNPQRRGPITMGDSPPPRLTDGYWLTDGTEVYVTAGRYAGEHGYVVNRAPDLRPGCAWIDLGTSGTHLLVSTRLAPTHKR